MFVKSLVPAAKTSGRYGAVIVFGVLFGVLAGAAQAQSNLTDVTLQLDWVLAGPNSGFMVAKDKGFYEEEGLDVAITQGKGSGNTAQLVGSGAADFGFSDGYVVGNAVSKGVDIKMVASIYRRNPTAMIVLANSGIETPKDIVGKTLALPAGSAQFQQFPAFAKGCGFDSDKVRKVNVDNVAEEAALLAGQVDAMAGYAQGSIPALEIAGKAEVRIFWFADCGVATLSNGIIVHSDMIKNTPELIAPFVRASVKGFLYARQNPEEAVSIVIANQPAADPAITLREMELSWETWVSKNTAGTSLGWMSPDDWAYTLNVLTTYGGVTDKVDPADVYTNAYIPEGDEFIPPQPVN